MKTLNLIICLLAVTISVACSKKKDGNGNANNGQYNQYGTTPNDLSYGNGYYNNQIPGYQINGQGSCQGPMFSDLVSYCGWLARDGERVCNPQLVRQTFMQYCQSFAVRFNYCVPQVQTVRCFRTGCGYQYQGKWELFTHYSNSDGDSNNDDGEYLKPIPGKPQPPVVVDPVVPVKPEPTQNSCDPSVDCRRKNPKKQELECKLPGGSDYKYTKAQYDVLCKNSNERPVAELPTTVVRPDDVQVADKPSEVSRGATTYPVADTRAAQVSELAAEKCLNVEEIRDFIADPKNKMASYSDYFSAQLNKTTHTKAYIDAWKLAVAPRLQKYPVSFAAPEHKSEYTAVGANIDQTETQFRLVADAARIMSCSSKRLEAQFYTVVGAVNKLNAITYSWNGLMDNDLELIETIRGEFKHGNETGTYILSRYIGVGKNMSAKQVEEKVTGDMKRKGFTEIDPQSVLN